MAAPSELLGELCAVVEQNNGVRITLANGDQQIQLPRVTGILKAEENRDRTAADGRDRIDVIILGEQRIQFNDLYHSTRIQGDKMIGMLWTVPMANILIFLKRTWEAVFEILLLALPPIPKSRKEKPAQHHDKQHHAHKNHPMEMAFFRRLAVNDDLTMALPVDFLTR